MHSKTQELACTSRIVNTLSIANQQAAYYQSKQLYSKLGGSLCFSLKHTSDLLTAAATSEVVECPSTAVQVRPPHSSTVAARVPIAILEETSFPHKPQSSVTLKTNK